ncbi:MAG TPA: hypothetical protein VGO73_12745 [Pyrinomonadaceae bacterium]|jgi:ElaB/YqjD/DUF883 family membrane-anchored ribosome-binding protein|nr:hypothetical protein [Pyrinomonadaceae bacterium]
MAEERTLGLARAREADSAEPSKEELQRRMEEARDSITNTVTEIKETVSQQYENVKDALDWREHFKKQPLAWTLGAAGVGFFVGYGIAAAFTGNEGDDRDNHYDRDEPHYASSPARSLTGQPITRETISAASPVASPATSPKVSETKAQDQGPSMLERFRETSAYERLSKEAGALGDRLVEELSVTAQQVVLPALLKKIKNWIGLDLSNKTPRQSSMGGQADSSSTYNAAVDARS